MDSGIFTDSDFVMAEMSGENIVQHGEELNPDDQCLITFIDEPAANVEFSTSEPSTSAASLRTAVESVGTLQYKSPKKKSNRGSKSMESAVLTAAEQVSTLRIRAEKRKANKENRKSKSPQKKTKPAMPNAKTTKGKVHTGEKIVQKCLFFFIFTIRKRFLHHLFECNASQMYQK